MRGPGSPDSAVLHSCTKLEQMLVSWSFVLLSGTLNRTVRLVVGGGGGSIWRPLKSPCPLVFNSENAAGHGSVGSCFALIVSPYNKNLTLILW